MILDKLIVKIFIQLSFKISLILTEFFSISLWMNLLTSADKLSYWLTGTPHLLEARCKWGRVNFLIWEFESGISSCTAISGQVVLLRLGHTLLEEIIFSLDISCFGLIMSIGYDLRDCFRLKNVLRMTFFSHLISLCLAQCMAHERCH